MVVLTELSGECGSLAKGLVFDLKQAMTEGRLRLYYQPQYDNNGRCIGAEALLRWEHETYGMLYPPLVIKIAAEAGLLFDLEKKIIAQAVSDSRLINQGRRQKLKLSVNVSAETIQDAALEAFLTTLTSEGYLKENPIYLEVTEQAAIV